jgi:hypothetical protein
MHASRVAEERARGRREKGEKGGGSRSQGRSLTAAHHGGGRLEKGAWGGGGTLEEKQMRGSRREWEEGDVAEKKE